MKALCQTNGRGKCSQCGTRIRAIRTCQAWLASVAGKTYVADVALDDCPHLLDPTGESVKLFGCGCASSSKNGILTSVFECEVYGRCAPFARGTHLSDNSIRRCSACADNPQLQVKGN